ncbi:MAG TPA: hypothetical protein VN698_12345 [Bacteroidia bacterium]|nr:hypothetical protein [Bacteroidia bacterium]
MQELDTTHNGGHPLVGDDLMFMQDGAREGGMATMQDVVGVPMVLSGCVFTTPVTGQWNWTAGLVYYNGNIYRLAAGSQVVSGAQYLNWQFASVTLSAGDDVYEDGSTQHTYIDYQASVIVNATVNDMRSTLDYYRAIKKSVKIFHNIVYQSYQTGTYTIYTITTPDDGVTRNYEVEFVATVNIQPNGGGQAHNQIEIKIGSTQQAFGEFWFNAPGTSGLGQTTTLTCKVIILGVAPNTAINFNQITLASNGPGTLCMGGYASVKEV